MSNFDLLQNKLNLTSNNISLISDNIANVNTPGYQRKFIDVQSKGFASALDSKVKQTKDKHMERSLPKSRNGVQELDAYIRTDKNGVDVDQEVIEMNQNKLFYNSLITLLNGQISNAKTIITSR